MIKLNPWKASIVLIVIGIWISIPFVLKLWDLEVAWSYIPSLLILTGTGIVLSITSPVETTSNE